LEIKASVLEYEGLVERHLVFVHCLVSIALLPPLSAFSSIAISCSAQLFYSQVKLGHAGGVSQNEIRISLSLKNPIGRILAHRIKKIGKFSILKNLFFKGKKKKNFFFFFI